MANYRTVAYFFGSLIIIICGTYYFQPINLYAHDHKYRGTKEYDMPLPLITSIITSDGKPTHALQELLNLCNLTYDGSLKNLVEVTQKAWLRAEGKERWEVEKIYEDLASKIVSLCEPLGLVQEIKPTFVHYDYVLVLGALADRVRARLAYLKKLSLHGVHFDTLVFLGGERPLQNTLESAEILCGYTNILLPICSTWKLSEPLPTTEFGMMKLVFEQSDLPESWRKLPQVWINTPMQQDQHGNMRRPNTADTIAAWLALNPRPGRCLVVSNQPYVPYQDIVVRTLLPASFIVDTVGQQADEEYLVALYLDTIARCLYQEQLRRLSPE